MVNLIELARQKLWVCEVGIDEDGEVSYNTTGFGQMLDANCRLFLKGKSPEWAPFAVALTPAAAAATLAKAIRERRQREAQAQPTRPGREPGEDTEEECGAKLGE